MKQLMSIYWKVTCLAIILSVCVYFLMSNDGQKLTTYRAHYGHTYINGWNGMPIDSGAAKLIHLVDSSLAPGSKVMYDDYVFIIEQKLK